MCSLERALSDVAGPGEGTNRLARILTEAGKSGTITYESIETIAGEDAEDVLLMAWEWKLLLPVRTSRCGEWDDRMLMMQPGEVYEMPNVVKLLVEYAAERGEWASARAIEEYFRSGGEPEWQRMPELVERIRTYCRDGIITASQISMACSDVGLGDRVDTMIAILKGAGVISPRLGSLARVSRTGVPLYEVNPCLYIELYEGKAGSVS